MSIGDRISLGWDSSTLALDAHGLAMTAVECVANPVTAGPCLKLSDV